MTPFPRTRREIRPWLHKVKTKLTTSGKRLLGRRRGLVIATACFVMVGIAMSAWALSGGDGRPGGRKIVPYSASKPVVKNVQRTSMKRAPAKDPLAAGRRLIDAKKYDAAIDVFQPLVREDVEARFWLGTAHLGAGHGFRGCRQLEKYLDLAPKGRYANAARTRVKKSC